MEANLKKKSGILSFKIFFLSGTLVLKKKVCIMRDLISMFPSGFYGSIGYRDRYCVYTSHIYIYVYARIQVFSKANEKDSIWLRYDGQKQKKKIIKGVRGNLIIFRRIQSLDEKKKSNR